MTHHISVVYYKIIIGAALISAGKAAFSAAHVTLLTTAGLVIGILAIVVFFMLSKYRT